MDSMKKPSRDLISSTTLHSMLGKLTPELEQDGLNFQTAPEQVPTLFSQRISTMPPEPLARLDILLSLLQLFQTVTSTPMVQKLRRYVKELLPLLTLRPPELMPLILSRPTKMPKHKEKFVLRSTGLNSKTAKEQLERFHLN